MLDRITPVILTYNEQDNIGRTLQTLAWANDIVIADSYSTDETAAIAKRCKQVRLFQRPFDSHAQQWTYAVTETGIKTEWVLALDADYILPPDFVEELRHLVPNPGVSGYRAGFHYCIAGKPLRGTLYPPVTVLFRRNDARYIQEGHTQRVVLSGLTGDLKARLWHDDRKPLSRWLQSQDRYMVLEAETIRNAKWNELGLAAKLRRLPPLAPFAAFFYCLILKRGLLDGRAGLYYATQRMLAEALLLLRLLESRSGQK